MNKQTSCPIHYWQGVLFLENYYPVALNGRPVGKVSVRRQGLYYCFSCRCRINSENIYRLIVCCGSKKEKLGILVPSDGCFLLNKKLPVKHIGEGEMTFYLTVSQEIALEAFIPISPEEPFAYLSRLKESFLSVRDGQPGILISQKQEC